VRCEECGRGADEAAAGWQAYRIDDEHDPAEDRLAFYCPSCAAREFASDDQS